MSASETRPPSTVGEIRQTINALWTMVGVLHQLPLASLSLKLAQGIAYTKLSNPERYARVGVAMEQDEVIANALHEAMEKIVKQIPGLGRTDAACASVSPPSSPPTSSPLPPEVK